MMTGDETAIFDQDRLLSADEVAAVLGIKKTTVSRWVFEEKIPFVKFGPGKKSIVKFNPRALNIWLAGLSHGPDEESDNSHKKNRLKQASKKTIDRFNQFVEAVR